MNDVRMVLCNALIDVKRTNDYTYDLIVGRQNERGNLPLTRKQLTNILKHNGKGVSVYVIEDILYTLGFEIEVMLKPHYN